jgi:quercetin dioxygenase-like cupin family protein/hemerythrin-like domain-containing protein
MTQPPKQVPATSFDLEEEMREMRALEPYEREGRTARTLVHADDLRVVLIVMRAGTRMEEHSVSATATVQTLRGAVALHLPDDTEIELSVGGVAFLEPGVRHDVEARAESAFLLTLGWDAEREAPSEEEESKHDDEDTQREEARRPDESRPERRGLERDERLRALSVDHHHALVLARRARRAAAGESEESLDEAWSHVRAAFTEELEPHFQIEEELLLPAMSELGEDELVEHTLRDHRRLRALVGTEDPSAATLDELGDALNEHVRFEERRLFPVAQRRLSADRLEAVAEATGDDRS